MSAVSLAKLRLTRTLIRVVVWPLAFGLGSGILGARILAAAVIGPQLNVPLYQGRAINSRAREAFRIQLQLKAAVGRLAESDLADVSKLLKEEVR